MSFKRRFSAVSSGNMAELIEKSREKTNDAATKRWRES